MSRLYVAPSGVYGNVADGEKVKYWNSVLGAWVTATEMRAWNGSAWATVWNRSSPLTLTFWPSFASNIRTNGSWDDWDAASTAADNTKADLFTGRFNGTYPYHYLSVLRFATDSHQGYGSLAAAMVTRPYIKSASLRLRRWSSGGYASPSGNLRIGTYTQSNVESLPTADLDGVYFDWDPMTVTPVNGWSYSTHKEFPVEVQTIYDHQAGKSIMFSEVMSGFYTSGATTFAYMRIHGMTAWDGNYLPMLTVTIDLV